MKIKVNVFMATIRISQMTTKGATYSSPHRRFVRENEVAHFHSWQLMLELSNMRFDAVDTIVGHAGNSTRSVGIVGQRSSRLSFSTQSSRRHRKFEHGTTKNLP